MVSARAERPSIESRCGRYNLCAPPVYFYGISVSPQGDQRTSGRKVLPVPRDQHDRITGTVMIVGAITSSNGNALIKSPIAVKLHVKCWRVPHPVARVCKSKRRRCAVRPRRGILSWICEWTPPRFGCIAPDGVKGVRFRVRTLDVKGLWDWDTGHGNGTPTKQSPYRTDDGRNRGCHHTFSDARAEMLAIRSMAGKERTPVMRLAYHRRRFRIRGVRKDATFAIHLPLAVSPSSSDTPHEWMC